ncbi:MAG: alpha-glucan family phosphorylase [Planctomycetota bacterium]
MSRPFHLFEISWEVCNKVGGIHTVVSTKAKTLVERFGDRYWAIGPWLLSHEQQSPHFEPTDELPGFAERCREMGLPIRVGRWKIPGRPRVVLVEFSGLIPQRDAILAGLWEKYRVDSLFGGWDYLEPVLFGHAAGRVIEAYWQEALAPQHESVVVQAHEWMTGTALLHLKRTVPCVGTIFTTHATILGRSIAATGDTPLEGLGDRTPDEVAVQVGVRSKHSLESCCAREADVFTTVSEITGDEAEVLHGRKPDPILPNGIDLSFMDEIIGELKREEVTARLRRLASVFCGEPLEDAALIAISGRYEMHNKGLDLLLEAMARVDRRTGGRQVVLFILVPAGNSGLRPVIQERLRSEAVPKEPLGLSTHNLFDADGDPVHQLCGLLGLKNAKGSRVKIIQVPVYLEGEDGLLDMPYEAALSGMDLSCFPSFYEPWGYTPEESLAVGVPTVTTDYAGFGRWCLEEGLGVEDGVWVLPRMRVPYSESAESLAEFIEDFLERRPDRDQVAETCRRTAQKTAWSDLIKHYERSFEMALAACSSRSEASGTAAYRAQVSLPVRPRPRASEPRLLSFEVSARLRPPFDQLAELSRNLWWAWDPEAPALFERISDRRWTSSGHNPVAFLREVYPEDLEGAAANPDIVETLERVMARFRQAMKVQPDDAVIPSDRPVAYFCAEYGLHESLPIYSGGLGLLAGDHLKAASDLGLPLVAVGLFYRHGYFTQRVTARGEQLAIPAENDPNRLPLTLVRDAEGLPLEVQVNLPGRPLRLRAWRVDVGRVPLYLLDADVDGNRPEDRTITEYLYGGELENRLLQEIVLGRGGARLLEKVGIHPSVFHMNEGHAAFLALERISGLIRNDGLTFDEAREVVRSTTIFTTHTPVPAGHDRFPEDLIRRYFSDVAGWLGLPWERFFELGGAPGDGHDFNMTYLALTFAAFVNGVSKKHQEVSKALLHPYWPSLLESEVPVSGITNGVHLPTWITPALSRELVGSLSRPVTADDFRHCQDKVDRKRLFEVRLAAKRRMFEVLEQRIRVAAEQRHEGPFVLNRQIEGLRDDALVVGFARRFAPYKRARLLLLDLQRLHALLGDESRPLIVIFAGKAHPRDGHGQALLREIFEASRSEGLLGKLYFIEDYDQELARAMVQGVDVWLNNPTRPLEASGTSGMKVAANGGLHLSVLDGWWCEAYDGKNGWTIGGGESMGDAALQDQMDASELYQLFEDELLPLFFDRGDDGLPHGWLDRVVHSLETIPPHFNTNRMVSEYRDHAYRPLSQEFATLSEDRWLVGRERAALHQTLRRALREVVIEDVTVSDLSDLSVGETVAVQVRVALGSLPIDRLIVELLVGYGRGGSDLLQPRGVQLDCLEQLEDGRAQYAGRITIQRPGSYASGVRLRVKGEGRVSSVTDGLMLWA